MFDFNEQDTNNWNAWRATRAGLLIAGLLTVAGNAFADDSNTVADRLDKRGSVAVGAASPPRMDYRGEDAAPTIDACVGLEDVVPAARQLVRFEICNLILPSPQIVR